MHRPDKRGVWIQVPHAENRVFDKPHDDGFQFGGGIGAGLETGIRITPIRHFYIEPTGLLTPFGVLTRLRPYCAFPNSYA